MTKNIENYYQEFVDVLNKNCYNKYAIFFYL